MKTPFLRSLWAALLLATASLAMAQQAPEGHTVTIFSQDGHPVWLIINGVKQNDKPSTNIRVTGLKQGWVKSKIIFQDSKMPAIDKTLQLEGVDPGWSDNVWAVTKNKKGAYELKLFSFEVRPKNQPKPAVHQTKEEEDYYEIPYHEEETFDAAYYHTPGMKVVVPGMTVQVDPGMMPNTKVQVTMPDDMEEMPAEQPARTQPARQAPQRTQPARPAPQRAAPAPKGCTTPMMGNKFNTALNSIKSESFTDNQLDQAKNVLRNNCLSVNQIRAVMKVFSFESTKLEWAKEAYAKCTNKDEYYLINSDFTYSSSKDELNDFLSSQE